MFYGGTNKLHITIFVFRFRRFNRFCFETILKDCIVGLTVKDRLGGNVFAINSFMTQENVDPTKKQYQYQFKIQFPSLNAGEYTIR